MNLENLLTIAENVHQRYQEICAENGGSEGTIPAYALWAQMSLLQDILLSEFGYLWQIQRCC